MAKECKIIAIANHKGGVGKTTSVSSLGVSFARKGKRVLLLDLDAQMNLSSIFGQTDKPKTIYEALVLGEPLPIYNVEKNLDICPASLLLARAEIDLSTKIAREQILKRLLKQIKDGYDFILIDCPPALGIVTTNAFVCSDLLFIPLTAEALPLQGLKMLENFVDEVNGQVGGSLKIGGIFITRYNHRKINDVILEEIERRYKNVLLKTKIRENVAITESPLFNKTVIDYNKKSNGAKDYSALAAEILKRVNK